MPKRKRWEVIHYVPCKPPGKKEFDLSYKIGYARTKENGCIVMQLNMLPLVPRPRVVLIPAPEIRKPKDAKDIGGPPKFKNPKTSNK